MVIFAMSLSNDHKWELTKPSGWQMISDTIIIIFNYWTYVVNSHYPIKSWSILPPISRIVISSNSNPSYDITGLFANHFCECPWHCQITSLYSL